jgi:chromosome segregation ATPase
MDIFNKNKSRTDNHQNVSLEDYDKKIEERKEEYDRLNDILRGMRAEVSNLMEEIQNLTDRLVRKNAEMFLLEQSIDDLKRSYELLQQNVKYEEDTLSKVNIELTNIKIEISESMQYYEKLNVIKNEYESVAVKLLALKEALEITKNNSGISPAVTNQKQLENNLKTPITQKKKKCKAKTKSGSKCKRFALDGSLFCTVHSSIVN